MYKYIIYLNSVFIFIIGFCYYFEYLNVQEQSLKLYGLLLLILSVILGCSQLYYLPKKISNYIIISCVCALLILQLIPMVDWFVLIISIPEDKVLINNYFFDLIPALLILVVCLFQVSIFLFKQRQLKKYKKLKFRT
ncbi:MAG TPA: hypothetical protein DCY20_05390 [Firmicutes bacterium]|nr:hypothetical protein [Bacillota bacterium]